MFTLLAVLVALAAASSVFSHPLHYRRRDEYRIVGRESSAVYKPIEAWPDQSLKVLAQGNMAFRDATDPRLLKSLADDGQDPPFMFLGCSDSRVSEGTIFNAKPGTMFVERNIANQFLAADLNTHSVLGYAVAELGVKHVIVMGHYGCGGVAAAIASPPVPVDAANGAVQSWIEPIRQLFQTSNRSEIVELRERNQGAAVVELPGNQEPGFRALVEENVKASVSNIAKNSITSNQFSLLSGSSNNTVQTRAAENSPKDLFIHGFVYDIENGEIFDLGVSVGPPGVPIPEVPFSAIVNAASSSGSAQSLSVEDNNTHYGRGSITITQSSSSTNPSGSAGPTMAV